MRLIPPYFGASHCVGSPSVDRVGGRRVKRWRGQLNTNRGHTGVVAIVDDDDDVGEVLRGLLETVGYQVETYKSGNEFLAEARPGQLACLVVDQNMPNMTGLEMLTQL